MEKSLVAVEDIDPQKKHERISQLIKDLDIKQACDEYRPQLSALRKVHLTYMECLQSSNEVGFVIICQDDKEITRIKSYLHYFSYRCLLYKNCFNRIKFITSNDVFDPNIFADPVWDIKFVDVCDS